jgi:pyruvate-ferredoxin/flavodoxin oxidoreductase
MRFKNLSDEAVAKAPKGFNTAAIKPKPVEGMKMILAIAAEDCYECGLCLNVCPMSKDQSKPCALSWKSYSDDPEFHSEQVAVWDYFLSLPETPAAGELNNAKALGYKLPLFEFSGACGGCGETPYIKLMSQLFGDRAIIANATGCSSIYGGNLPTTPYCQRADGRGPAWSNSLFEDAAEFAMGFRLTSDKLAVHVREMAEKAKSEGIAAAIIDKLLNNTQADDAAIDEQRKNVDELKATLKNDSKPTAKLLLSLADHFVKRSVWAFGGVLSCVGKLGNSPERCCFGHLSAGVGVYLCVHDQQVNIFAGSNHMIQSAKTNVISPAISTECPYRPFNKVVGKGQQQFCRGFIVVFQSCF